MCQFTGLAVVRISPMKQFRAVEAPPSLPPSYFTPSSVHSRSDLKEEKKVTPGRFCGSPTHPPTQQPTPRGFVTLDYTLGRGARSPI